ncbi:hypothetical protein ASG11_14430 [Sphingomonas sp. Leaf357]|uniref:helix-turn-helix transcriptional regulator n=1 Tax=Sphingomonas sp. Leaf357 TaxID=1736350 RepID=UPI0006FAB62F|nr:response regulator transcription factor [Sphingomonas sp. Leaf357]KQS02002.1 hypothetical protein ASG11_14430 [Sphingomonas sp. Leaf357]
MGQLDSIDWDARFQQAALDPSGWLPVLRDMASATGSARGQLIGVGGPNAVPFNWVTDFPDEALSDFVRMDGGSPRINFRIAADLEFQPGTVVHEADYRRARGRLASDTYVDFCHDREIPLGCHTALIAEDQVMIGLALLRTTRDGVTTEDQRTEFARAARAARSAVRLQRAIEHQGADLVTGTLEAMAADCLLIDGFGRVGSMTPGAERAIAEAQAIRIVDGMLGGATPPTSRRIAQALRAVLAGNDPARVALGGGRRLELFALARREWALSFSPQVIAILRDPQAELGREVAAVARDFGLSPAEAAVTRLLVGGLDRDAVAALRGVSAGTLKSQIKAIYQKTGCAREAELVALVAGLNR